MTYTAPKGETGIVATTDIEASSPHESSIITPSFDKRATKKLLRKMDLHIVPFFTLLYL